MLSAFKIDFNDLKIFRNLGGPVAFIVTRGACLRLARKLKEQRRIAADFDRPRVEELGGDQRLALGQQPIGRLRASGISAGQRHH